MKMSLARRTVAEFLGTGFLVAAVVGSGIMGERLAGGNIAIALLANTLATGAVLVVLILTFGPISGAHFNPVVSLADAWEGGISCMETSLYVLAQISGGMAGTVDDDRGSVGRAVPGPDRRRIAATVLHAQPQSSDARGVLPYN